MNASERNFHLKYGAQSGIPDCCCKFFVDEWLPTCETLPVMHAFYLNLMTEMKLSGGPDFEHIPCPNCLMQRNVVDVIACDPDPSLYPYEMDAHICQCKYHYNEQHIIDRVHNAENELVYEFTTRVMLWPLS